MGRKNNSKRYTIHLYDDHRYVLSIDFREKWKARLFHILLNSNINPKSDLNGRASYVKDKSDDYF